MSDAIDLNSPEVKAAIQEAVDAAIAPLVTKKDELLAENKKLKQGRQISPEDVATLESQIETLKTDLNKATGDLKKANKTAEDATKALETETGFTTKLLADNGLSDALVKAGVTNPAHLKAVKALLASQVQIVAEGDTRIAKVGDKPLTEFVTEWAKSDDGKHFVAATQNNGGGAGGGSQNSNSKTMTRSEFDSKTPTEKMEFSKAGGTVTT